MNTSNKTSDIAFKQVKDFAEGRMSVTPASVDVVNVHVDLFATVLAEYKEELFLSWDQKASMRGMELTFSQEELSLYLDMLVITRVTYCLGKRVDVRPTDGIAVPSFLSLVLSNVGLARNDDLGIELRPAVKSDVVIDPDFMWRISRAIRALSNIGVEYAEGYTRDRTGSYDFMSMTLIEEHVKCPDKTPHPVYALMASTLGIRGIETVLSPRINYGSVSYMRTLVRHLAATKG